MDDLIAKYRKMTLRERTQEFDRLIEATRQLVYSGEFEDVEAETLFRAGALYSARMMPCREEGRRQKTTDDQRRVELGRAILTAEGQCPPTGVNWLALGVWVIANQSNKRWADLAEQVRRTMQSEKARQDEAPLRPYEAPAILTEEHGVEELPREPAG